MVEVLYDTNGNIKAFCEWQMFNETGVLDDKGTIMFIEEMEMNKDWRGKGLIKEFMIRLLDKAPQMTKCFFLERRSMQEQSQEYMINLMSLN